MPRVLLAHARDDDAVPFAHSERLAEVLAPPTEFIALAEGGHHGPGRSPLVARATIDWVKVNGD
jgi:dipeptidyl aminopeptidase/acylaminoacyl peptidase